MKEAVFFCIVGLPLFGKEGSGTPVFKILVRALNLELVPKSLDYFIMFQDKSMVDPFPIPLVILGGKYDVFQVLY